MPRVSLIVPVFNTAPFLRECLESVLAQTFPDWELVCVDDGSADESPRILAEYSARDERIVAMRQPNSGQGAARNAGLDRSRGEYVLFLDSDDLLDSGALAELVKTCDAGRLDHLIFGARCFSSAPEADAERMAALDRMYAPPADLEGRVVSGRELFKALASTDRLCVSPCLRMMRRASLENPRCRFPEGVLLEDNVFTPFAVLAAERASVAGLVCYRRRLHPASTTANPDWRVRRAADGLAAYVKFLRIALGRGDGVDVRLALGRFGGCFLEACLAQYASLDADGRSSAEGRLAGALDEGERGLFELAVRPAVVAHMRDLASRGGGVRGGILRRLGRRLRKAFGA